MVASSRLRPRTRRAQATNPMEFRRYLPVVTGSTGARRRGGQETSKDTLEGQTQRDTLLGIGKFPPAISRARKTRSASKIMKIGNTEMVLEQTRCVDLGKGWICIEVRGGEGEGVQLQCLVSSENASRHRMP